MTSAIGAAWSVRVAERSFAAITRLLPRRMGCVSAADVRHLFARIVRDEYQAHGVRGVGTVWLRAVVDLLRRLPDERHPRRPGGRHGDADPHRNGPVMTLMNNLWSDLRLAVRGLGRYPLHAAVVVATLALGIGANTAIFSIVYGVLMRPLAYPEAERLVRIVNRPVDETVARGPIPYLNAIDIRERAASLEKVSAYDEWRPNLTGSGEPERLEGATVNAEFFDVLRIAPYLGRFFVPAEDLDGNDRVVVLSYGLWMRKFGGDPEIVGAQVLINGNAHAVVGVAPPDFEDPGLSGSGWDAPEIWRPLGYFGMAVEDQPSRGSQSYTAVARLAPGVGLDAAQAEVDAISAALLEENPDTNRTTRHALVPLHDDIVMAARPSLLMVLGAVGFLLAVAVVNVANLTIARASNRDGETALRAALGAGRGRLAQLFLVEALVLAGLGGVAGVVLAQGLVRLALAQSAGAFPREAAVRIDPAVLLFAVSITCLTGIAFGLAPALRARTGDPGATLQGVGKGGLGPARGTGRRLLVVAQVAIALILLTGAGLLVRSFLALTAVDRGFDSSDLLTFSVALPFQAYPENADHARAFTGLARAIEALPGVDAVASINILPLSGNYDCNGARPYDRPESPDDEEVCPEFRTVSSGYASVLRLGLVSGRFITEQDRSDTEVVAVLNETAARQLWPGAADVLGKQLTIYSGRPATVVGVVRDEKMLTLDEAANPGVYVALEQAYVPWQTSRATFVARISRAPERLIPRVREQVAALDSSLPISDLQMMEEVVAASVAAPRFRTLVSGAFASLALALAAIGVYGVVSSGVASRRQEMAVRVALGAEPRQVVARVLRGGLGPVAIGILVGMGGAVAMSRSLAGLLYGIPAVDPVAFIGVPVLLALVSAVAALVPARRASRVDPVEALRGE